MSWPLATAPSAIGNKIPRTIFAAGAPEAVSTERPLIPLTLLGLRYEDLVFTIRNRSPDHPIAVYIDRSEGGVKADASRDLQTVPADSERQFPYRDVMTLYWSLSAAGDPDNGNPSCDVTWSITGRLRR